MRACVFILLAACWITSAVYAQSDCKTPNSLPGNCINVRKCPTLLRIFSQKPISPENTQFLRRSQCGYEGRTPKVCCPINTIPAGEPSTDRSISTAGVIHPNRRLLPDYPKCGLSLFFEKVVGGEDSKIGEFPWTALLGYTTTRGQLSWRCGASLINNRYVMTAAHCINTPGATLTHVRLGEHTISSDTDCFGGYCAPPAQDFGVESTVTHPEYNKPRFRNDIALVRLDAPVTFSNFIQPICLPFAELSSNSLENLDRLQYTAFVAGWGRTDFAIPTGSDILQKLRVPIVPLRQCSVVFRSQVQLDKEQFCAGGVKGQDSCRGDSGGALMLIDAKDGTKICFYAAGVVSIGPTRCGEGGLPGIYTRVGAFLPWILDNISP